MVPDLLRDSGHEGDGKTHPDRRKAPGMYVDQGNASTVLSTQVSTHSIMPTNVSATCISTKGLCACVCDGKDVLMEVLCLGKHVSAMVVVLINQCQKT